MAFNHYPLPPKTITVMHKHIASGAPVPRWDGKVSGRIKSGLIDRVGVGGYIS